MDVAAGGTLPVQYQNEAFYNIEQPNTQGELRTLIGLFGLYSQFLPYMSWISDPVVKYF